MRRGFFAPLALLLFPLLAVADATPTIEESLNLKQAEDPQISPDGRYVAYTVQEPNWDDNEFKSEIWIAVTTTGANYPLTHSKKSSMNMRWSPDSRRLAFISNRDGKRQLYVIAACGGEAAALTNSETGVSSFRWSPDGRHIAFTAAEPESRAKKERKKKYGGFEILESQYTMTQLWRIEVPVEAPAKPPETQRLTEGDQFTVGSFAWSPDGKRIAFDATRDPDPGSKHTSAIYVLTIASRAVNKVVDAGGPHRNPVWSSDGNGIAYETANGQEFFYYANRAIAVVPAGGGTPELLSGAFDEQPWLHDWAPEGIYFTGLQKTAVYLHRMDPATKEITRVSAPNSWYSPVSFTRDYRRIAFLQGDPRRLPEVCVADLKDFKPKRLTVLGEQLKPYRTASREVVQWKSTDGTPIEGILMKQADFDPGKRYPLLVVIHPGPEGVDTPALFADRYYPLERFAAKGALILRPNYRGSAGYGAKFRALNVRNLGCGDYEDVISGVDHLVGRGLVDRDRVGAMGWSQGGYIAAYITTFSDRFKAVSVGAGISNWTTYYVNTDIHPFTRQYLKATPWDDPEIYRKTSPISYLKTAKTPTLIQHGENDKRVPISNAYELYQGLKDRGVPVKLVVFKGFNHLIDKPREQRAMMEQNYAWFSQWIWGEMQDAVGKEVLEAVP